jgi:hypothetical protein
MAIAGMSQVSSTQDAQTMAERAQTPAIASGSQSDGKKSQRV